MITKEEFAFTIGYDGPAAVVDSQAKAQYGSMSTEELVGKGYFRAAFAKALLVDDAAGIQTVMNSYNQQAGTSFTKEEQLSRLFGVFKEKPIRVKRL